MKILAYSVAGAVLLGLPVSVTGYLVDPPTTADSTTVLDCSGWIVASSSDTCAATASANFISLSDFQAVYNPSLGSACKLKTGQSYCVERNWGVAPPVTSTSTAPTPTGGNGITTPLPTQSGMVNNYNKFVFVTSGGCWDLANEAGILLEDFYAWNKGVGDKCQKLWADTWYCIGIIGGTTTTTASLTGTKTTTGTATTTTTGNGVTTLLPTQPGMGCSDVANENGISFSDFYAWNKGIGDTCGNMWSDTWYYVGLIGQTTTTKPPSTSPTKTTTTSITTIKGNGISIPMPTQPGGMTPNCDKFYLVATGELCSDVLKKNGLTMAQFYALNPGVLDDCRGMWGGVYVCVDAFK